MSKGFKVRDGYHQYTAFLFFTADGQVRLKKNGGGSHADERVCKVDFKIPSSAFTIPEYQAVITLDKSDVEGTIDADVIRESLEANLTEFPVIVEVMERE